MSWIISLGCIIVGILIGTIATIWRHKSTSKPVGTLRIDQSDPYDGPYLFLELSTSIDELMKQEHVTVVISTENYISQK